MKYSKSYRNRNRNHGAFLTLGGLVLFVFLIVLGSAAYQYGTVENVTIVVTRTERITSGAGDSITSKWMVFTDKEVFQNTDSLWHAKFDSTDMENEIVPGRTYKAKVYGWRVPFLSWYRNIVEITEADAK